jgi:hypothetical protein
MSTPICRQTQRCAGEMDLFWVGGGEVGWAIGMHLLLYPVLVLR